MYLLLFFIFFIFIVIIIKSSLSCEYKENILKNDKNPNNKNQNNKNSNNKYDTPNYNELPASESTERKANKYYREDNLDIS